MFTVATVFRRAVAAILLLAASPALGAEAPAPTSIGQLLADGWEIAGYAPSLAMVGSVILFKHKDRNFLVQCTAVYDATRGAARADRVITNCYEIK
jgi:hypothetical protein